MSGREYNDDFLKALPEGVDPCGENGEFHSFAFDGPMFNRPIEFTIGETVERDGFVFTDLAASESTIVNVQVALPHICISNLSLSLKLLAFWRHSLDVFIGATLTGLLSRSIFHMKRKQESIMTRASLDHCSGSTSLCRVSRARRKTALRCGGLSLEGRIPRESAKANRPLTLAPTKMSFGRQLWGLDCRLPSFGKDVSS